LMSADVQAACRMLSNRNLGDRARRIVPKHRLSDIVLPDEQRTQLEEVCQQSAHRHVVLGQWGFGRKVSLGKGLNVLFSGPPGTGKTMAAEGLANELQLELYKIDLSQVVSKYIGETEKNLDQVFRAAQSSNAILFFDEADALFGKRSEVSDAHDRYANIEVAYLLQKMEEYEGISILATNLKKNLDEAFVRRIQFIVDFPFPDAQFRRRLWRGMFPAEAPRDASIDLDLLAARFPLAGGNIQNVVINASYLAASNGGLINMKHLMRATRSELKKLGRVINEADFCVPDGRPAPAAARKSERRG